MEKREVLDESVQDSMSAGCNDEQNDSLPAWASGLRQRAHLCKSRLLTVFTEVTNTNMTLTLMARVGTGVCVVLSYTATILNGYQLTCHKL